MLMSFSLFSSSVDWVDTQVINSLALFVNLLIFSFLKFNLLLKSVLFYINENNLTCDRVGSDNVELRTSVSWTKDTELFC